MTKQTHKRKRDFECAASLHLTFHPTILVALDDLVARGGYKGPGEYFSACVRLHSGMEKAVPSPVPAT